MRAPRELGAGLAFLAATLAIAGCIPGLTTGANGGREGSLSARGRDTAKVEATATPTTATQLDANGKPIAATGKSPTPGPDGKPGSPAPDGGAGSPAPGGTTAPDGTNNAGAQLNPNNISTESGLNGESILRLAQGPDEVYKAYIQVGADGAISNVVFVPENIVKWKLVVSKGKGLTCSKIKLALLPDGARPPAYRLSQMEPMPTPTATASDGGGMGGGDTGGGGMGGGGMGGGGHTMTPPPGNPTPPPQEPIAGVTPVPQPSESGSAAPGASANPLAGKAQTFELQPKDVGFPTDLKPESQPTLAFGLENKLIFDFINANRGMSQFNIEVRLLDPSGNALVNQFGAPQLLQLSVNVN